MRHKLWETWAKALGEKAHSNKKHADHVAIVRTFIFATYLITNLFIIAGVIRHWNDEVSPTEATSVHGTIPPK